MPLTPSLQLDIPEVGADGPGFAQAINDALLALDEALPVDVTKYGVDPTGVAECFDQWQEAIDAAIANGRPGVYVPPGAYRIEPGTTRKSLKITASLRIFAAVVGQAVLNSAPQMTVAGMGFFEVTATSVESHVVFENLVMHGPTVIGADHASGSADWAIFSNCFFVRWYGSTNVKSTLVTRNLIGDGLGMDGLQWSGKGAEVRHEHNDIFGNVSGVGCFESTNTMSVRLVIKGGRYWSDPVNGDPTCVGMYIHPSVEADIDGAVFESFGRWGVYFNGNTPAIVPKKQVVRACRFYECDMVQTGSNGTTTVTACSETRTVAGGSTSILIRQDAVLSDLHFSGPVPGIQCLGVAAQDVVADQLFWEAQSGTCILLALPAGDARWTVTNAVMELTGDGVAVNGTTGTYEADLNSITISGSTTAYAVHLQGSGAVAHVRFSRPRLRLTSALYGFRLETGMGSIEISDMDVLGGAYGSSVISSAGLEANVLSGANNRFRQTSGDSFSGSSSNQQRMARRRGICPTKITVSGANQTLDLTTAERCSYDTFVLAVSTAGTTLQTITDAYAFVSPLNLIVELSGAGTFALVTTGNLVTPNTSVRATDSGFVIQKSPDRSGAVKYLEMAA